MKAEESLCLGWASGHHRRWLATDIFSNLRLLFQFRLQVALFDFFTGVFTLFELVVQEERTQVAGVVMVLDCKGFGLTHVRSQP